MNNIIDPEDPRIIDGVQFLTAEHAQRHIIDCSIPDSKYFNEYASALLGLHEGRPVYSELGIVMILVERDGMTMDEAKEYVDYNVYGLCHGDCYVINVEDPDDWTLDNISYPGLSTHRRG